MKFVLLLALIISGCGSVTSEQYEKAAEMCAPHSGVYRVEGSWLSSKPVDVKCKNGVLISAWMR